MRGPIWAPYGQPHSGERGHLCAHGTTTPCPFGSQSQTALFWTLEGGSPLPTFGCYKPNRLSLAGVTCEIYLVEVGKRQLMRFCGRNRKRVIGSQLTFVSRSGKPLAPVCAVQMFVPIESNGQRTSQTSDAEKYAFVGGLATGSWTWMVKAMAGRHKLTMIP